LEVIEVKTAMLIPLIGATLLAAHSYAAENFELEPCINGRVSAYGLYPTQELDDRAQELVLEPCINGQVSESGLYVSQLFEDRVRDPSTHEPTGLVADQ
jgi:hypothetical protein